MDLFDHMITFYFQIGNIKFASLQVCNKSWESQFCVAVSSYFTTDLQYKFFVRLCGQIANSAVHVILS